jgi:hypothetical protein
VIWIAGPAHSSDPATLKLTVSPDATFKFFRQVHQDGKYDWIDVPVPPETGHEIIDLLHGAEPYVVDSTLQLQWNWPPVQRVYGNYGSFAPDNGLLDVYEGDGNERSLRIGFLLVTGLAMPHQTTKPPAISFRNRTRPACFTARNQSCELGYI